VAADVSTANGCTDLLRQVPEADILVNNAGIFEPKPFTEIPDADWERFYQVNVMSGVRLTRAYLPGMLGRNWGRVIFMSSESGIQIPQENSRRSSSAPCVRLCRTAGSGGQPNSTGQRHKRRSHAG
jgi:NAD(P)-dependent dehydrogenase (short-subunit alcohol dehydrogenase family)